MSKENRVSDELLPCPFCGGTATLSNYRVAEDAMGCHVACTKCLVQTDVFEDAYTPFEQAICAWNTRSKPVAGVEVKPLEWGSKHEDATGYLSYDAKSVLGTYSIYRIKNGGVWSCERGVVNIGQFSSETEAKAAAEADYRQRILSTLLLPAQEPAFYGVWSGKIHIGTWADEKTAREVASEYDSPAVVPLYAFPQPQAVITKEMVERAARVIDPALWALFADQQERTGEPMAEMAARSGRWAAAKETARSALEAALKEA